MKRKVFSLLLSDSEKKLFDSAASLKGLSTAEYIRIMTKLGYLTIDKQRTNIKESFERSKWHDESPDTRSL